MWLATILTVAKCILRQLETVAKCILRRLETVANVADSWNDDFLNHYKIVSQHTNLRQFQSRHNHPFETVITVAGVPCNRRKQFFFYIVILNTEEPNLHSTMSYVKSAKELWAGKQDTVTMAA